tara:strand:- start:2859 stop:3446 length:588 start_codon:yes stop_codon:yes gene_type:complete
MRLPIALTPLNLLLISLMIIAPQLGKFAREIVEEKENKKNLDTVISRRVKSQTNSKRKKIENRKRKKTVSRLALLEKAEKKKKNLSRSNNPRAKSMDKYPMKLDEGRKLLTAIKSEHSTSKPHARSLSKKSDKKSFITELKELARNRNYSKAEKIFMSRLENMRLAPLESLDKQSKFKAHFSRLVKQLDTQTSTN